MEYELLKETLRLVAERLDKNNINWFLIGSFNLFLQGIDVKVHDIDIMVSYDDFEKTQELFLDFEIKQSKVLGNGEGKELLYSINNIEVEFCFEYDNGFYIRRLGGKINRTNIKLVHLDHNIIYCFKLEDELAAYKYLGREDKIKIISNFLENANR